MPIRRSQPALVYVSPVSENKIGARRHHSTCDLALLLLCTVRYRYEKNCGREYNLLSHHMNSVAFPYTQRCG